MRSTSAMSTPIPMIKSPPALSRSVLAADSDYTGTVVTPTKTVTAKRGTRKPGPRDNVNSTWTDRNVRGIRSLLVPVLAKLPWLVHGFSTRPGGVSPQDGEEVL